MGVQATCLNIKDVKILHCNQFYWYTPWVLPHFDKIAKSESPRLTGTALIINMLTTMAGGRNTTSQLQLTPLQTHALKRALKGLAFVFFPGPFNLPLSYLILHFLLSLRFYTFSSLFKHLTPLSTSSFSALTLQFHGENRSFQKRTCVSSHHHFFPLPARTHTLLCSLWIDIQTFHLCLISFVPLT